MCGLAMLISIQLKSKQGEVMGTEAEVALFMVGEGSRLKKPTPLKVHPTLES